MTAIKQLIDAHEERLRLAVTGLPVRLIVRTNAPWATMTREDFYSQKPWLQPPLSATDTVARLKGKRAIDLWEAAYGLDYCQYRARIREACDAVNMRAPWDNVSRGLDSVSWEQGEEILVCVDDDDTFEPGVVAALKDAFTPGVNLVRWARRINVLGYVQPDSVFPTTYLDTCNWAVRKSFLYYWEWQQSIEYLAFHWLAHLMTAKRWAKATPKRKPMFGMLPTGKPWVTMNKFDDQSLVELPGQFSTYYVHTGSISYLDNKHGSYSGSALTEFLRGKPLHPLYSP